MSLVFCIIIEWGIHTRNCKAGSDKYMQSRYCTDTCIFFETKLINYSQVCGRVCNLHACMILDVWRHYIERDICLSLLYRCTYVIEMCVRLAWTGYINCISRKVYGRVIIRYCDSSVLWPDYLLLLLSGGH